MKHCGLISYAGRSSRRNKAAFFGKSSESSYPQVIVNNYWKTTIIHFHFAEKDKQYFHDRGGSSFRFFQEGDVVHIRNFRGGEEKWIQAKVLKRLRTVTYLIQEGQRQRIVHVDHMLPWRGNAEALPPSLPPVAKNMPPLTMDCTIPAVLPSTAVKLTPPAVLINPTEQVVEVSPSPVSLPSAKKSSQEKRQYPERVRVPP